jgi:hypothetical protein
MAVVTTVETAGVWAGLDAAFNTIVPQMLNYSELRISRDLDLLASQTSNTTYVLTAGVGVLKIPIDDFLTLQTFEITQMSGSSTVNATPLLPVSKEFIQNCYGGLTSSGAPQYYAMIGDDFGDGADTFNKVLLGPTPNFAYTVRVTGTIRTPSLFKYATTGVADTSYTYISAYYPDMLIMASMIYISAFQRNFGPASDTPESGMTYEKQYQALRLGAIAEENRKKLQGSAWSAYSTPTSATPTR